MALKNKVIAVGIGSLAGIMLGLVSSSGLNMLEKDILSNSSKVLQLEKDVEVLHTTLDERDRKFEQLQTLYKALRTTLNTRNMDIALQIDQKIDDRWKEQTATGGLGVLTGDLPTASGDEQ